MDTRPTIGRPKSFMSDVKGSKRFYCCQNFDVFLWSLDAATDQRPTETSLVLTLIIFSGIWTIFPPLSFPKGSQRFDPVQFSLQLARMRIFISISLKRSGWMKRIENRLDTRHLSVWMWRWSPLLLSRDHLAVFFFSSENRIVSWFATDILAVNFFISKYQSCAHVAM